MGFEELTGGCRFLITLLGLPELQQGFEHMQAVVYRSHAEQRCGCRIGDERRRLARKAKLDYVYTQQQNNVEGFSKLRF